MKWWKEVKWVEGARADEVRKGLVKEKWGGLEAGG